jgi:undecaprenyl-diphosphatase
VAQLDRRYEKASTTTRMSGIRTQHPVAWRFLSGRFAQSQYLALHLLVGFALSLAVIAVFASITEGLVDSSPLTRFDVVIGARLRESVTPGALRAFAAISSLGSRGLEAVGWCAAFIGGAALDAALRFVVRRSELPFADLVLLDWGTGLASGQALGVLVGYGMLAYALSLVLRSALARTAVVTIMIALVAAITVSRLYLGQHYVSDATAGLAAGLLWLATCASGIEVARQRRWER